MSKLTGILVSRGAMLLAGVVIGWLARTLTGPKALPDSPDHRPVAEIRSTPFRASLNDGVVAQEGETTGHSQRVVSSSLDATFDFPAEWDAVRCARESLKELNEYRRMQMFQRAMQRLTPETAARMQEETFSASDREGKWFIGEYRFFLRRWAEIDGRNAIEFAVNRGAYDPNGWGGFIRQTLGGWAANDPEASVNWINDKENLGEWVVNASMSGIIDGLTERDPDRAVSFVLAQADSPERSRLFSDLTERLIYGPGMARAEQWLTQIPAEPEFLEAKSRVFSQIIDRQLRGEAEDAAAFISRHASEPRLNLGSVQRVAREMRKDPEKFTAWRNSLPLGFLPEPVEEALPQ